ncbi:hypothetical protein BU26DRAFT_238285 [Trematosphaeria pertusa]|uniref:Uncharacterized protein n=1 Tax=Trematosphaeria pertusa TaxID=390896 RepID=A0A6A6HQA3_9PLEO|nr:uncharacterized protein BU26DRAFT_238285 [Trematosphaeria pertusa]KAF2240305.1 hypothetical protein BU26DRAFT_238285 [Trematosphaeria pertusa]
MCIASPSPYRLRVDATACSQLRESRPQKGNQICSWYRLEAPGSGFPYPHLVLTVKRMYLWMPMKRLRSSLYLQVSIQGAQVFQSMIRLTRALCSGSNIATEYRLRELRRASLLQGVHWMQAGETFLHGPLLKVFRPEKHAEFDSLLSYTGTKASSLRTRQVGQLVGT